MADGNIPIKVCYQSHSESKDYSAVFLFHVMTSCLQFMATELKKTETENLRLYIFQIF